MAATWHAGEVDPRIGTGGDGYTFHDATVPFGMIQLSPCTAMPDFKHACQWAAGYQYSDPTIMGFSHTHFSSSGHSDLGDVLVMPIAGDVKLDPGDPAKPGSGYRSRFSHATEAVQAGYYAVTLADYGVRAALQPADAYTLVITAGCSRSRHVFVGAWLAMVIPCSGQSSTGPRGCFVVLPVPVTLAELWKHWLSSVASFRTGWANSYLS